MRTHKKTISFLVLLMVTILVLAVATGIGNQSQGTPASPKHDVTSIHEERMTDKQRAHGRLYKGFGNGKKLKHIAAEIRGGVKVKRNTPLPVGESIPAPTLSDFSKRLACNADAVVVGVVNSKSSQLTEDGDFIFTDYELNIEDVLKDNAQAHLVPNISFTLTRPGGKVLLNGYILEAEDASFKPLAIGGRYTLFLKFIPSTGAYASLNSTSTYELRGNKVTGQTEEAAHPELNNENPAAFVNNVRAVSVGCDRKGGKNE